MELGNFRGPNAGWIQQLWMVLAQDVLEMTGTPARPEEMALIPGGLLLADESVLKVARFPRGVASVSSQSEASGNGESHTLSIAFSIPKPSIELMQYLGARPGARWVAGWLDFNSQAYLAGEHSNGLRLAYSHGIGDQNALSLTLSGRFLAPYYSSAEHWYRMNQELNPPAVTCRVSRLEHFEQDVEIIDDAGIPIDIASQTFTADLFDQSGTLVDSLTEGDGLSRNLSTITITLLTAQMETLSGVYRLELYSLLLGERYNYVTLFLIVS